MNRQQRRAAERKELKSKVKTYNLTEAQLQAYVRQAIEQELKNNHEEVMTESIHELCVGIL